MNRATAFCRRPLTTPALSSAASLYAARGRSCVRGPRKPWRPVTSLASHPRLAASLCNSKIVRKALENCVTVGTGEAVCPGIMHDLGLRYSHVQRAFTCMVSSSLHNHCQTCTLLLGRAPSAAMDPCNGHLLFASLTSVTHDFLKKPHRLFWVYRKIERPNAYNGTLYPNPS